MSKASEKDEHRQEYPQAQLDRPKSFPSGKKVPCAFSVDADRSPEASESGMLKFRIPAEKGVKYTIFCARGPFQRRVS